MAEMAPVKGEILAVDDEPESLALLTALLGQAGYSVRSAPNGELALWSANHRAPDLIILAMHMPGMNGLEVCRGLKQQAHTFMVPVIFLSGSADLAEKLAGFEAGCIDFITKPFVEDEVLARVETHMRMALAAKKLLRARVAHARSTPPPSRMPTRSASPEILVVEDSPAAMYLMSSILSDAGYSVREAPNGDLALWTAARQPPDLILLDIQMPGMNGYDVCRALKRDPATAHVPVIFLSALTDSEDQVAGFAVGGVDYIAKPFNELEVLARIKTHLHHALPPARLAGLDTPPELPGSVQPADIEIDLPGHSPFANAAPGHAAPAPAHSTHAPPAHAPAGDLRPVHYFEAAYGDSAHAALLISAYGRIISGNAAFVRMTGHSLPAVCGRMLLDMIQEPASPLLKALHDEHASLLVGSLETVMLVMAQAALQPCQLSVLRIDPLGEDANHYLALLAPINPAPANGHPIFVEGAGWPGMPVDGSAQEPDIRGAHERGELEVLYQPIVGLASRRLAGAEGVLRWRVPGGKVLPTAHFHTLAEETGEIVPIGAWAIHQVCAQLAAWGPVLPEGFRIAMTLSLLQFWQESLPGTIETALKTHAIAPGQLEFAISGTVLQEDLTQALAMLRRLKKLGVKLALEDWVGLPATLNPLHWMPVDVLKVDAGLLASPASPARDTLMAHGPSPALKLLAKHVEQAEQIRRVRHAGCHLVQGPLLAVAASAGDFFIHHLADHGKLFLADA